MTKRAWLLLIGFGLVAGIALRAWALSTSLGTLESDEAVWGLMARHMLEGEFTPFFWGQTYGGTQETALTAGVFWIMGSSIAALRFVPIALYALSGWLLWRLGRRTIGEAPAAVATAIFLIGPAWLIYKSTRAHGFYTFAMAASLAILLIVLRLRQKTSWSEAGWLGLLIGLGWWATPQIVLIAAPALLWLFLRNPSSLRTAPLMAAAACVGALPWLVDNFKHGFHSLNQPPQLGAPANNAYGDHLVGFFEHGLPSALGLRVPWAQDWAIPTAAGWAVYAALLAGFVLLLILRPRPLELLLVIGCAYPFIVALSEFSWYVDEPRYLFLLFPVIALLLGWALSLRGVRLAGVGILAILALSVTGLVMMKNGKLDFTRVVATLESRGIDRAFAYYPIAYPISFVADERVIATAVDHVRYEPHDDAVRLSPNPPWIFAAGSTPALAFEQALGRMGIAYAQIQTMGLVIYSPSASVFPGAIPGVP